MYRNGSPVCWYYGLNSGHQHLYPLSHLANTVFLKGSLGPTLLQYSQRGVQESEMDTEIWNRACWSVWKTLSHLH